MTLATATLAALLAFVLAHALDVQSTLCHDVSPLVEFALKKQTASKAICAFEAASVLPEEWSWNLESVI